jgi:hypothetical protein
VKDISHEYSLFIHSFIDCLRHISSYLDSIADAVSNGDDGDDPIEGIKSIPTMGSRIHSKIRPVSFKARYVMQ